MDYYPDRNNAGMSDPAGVPEIGHLGQYDEGYEWGGGDPPPGHTCGGDSGPASPEMLKAVQDFVREAGKRVGRSGPHVCGRRAE